jgi:hypothetical protein
VCSVSSGLLRSDCLLKETKMRGTFSRAMWIIEIAKNMAEKALDHGTRNRLEDIQIHEEYAEPGYDSKGPILTGNWNPISWDKTKKEDDLIFRLGEILEKIGCELEWEDEWSTCADCSRLVRTEPDSYGWTPSYAILNECELVCADCIKENPDDYLKELENNPLKAVTFDIDLEKQGYIHLDDKYENGWYGTTDDPKKIAKGLRAKGVERFIFAIDGKGQFNIEFSVWVHESEIGKVNGDEDEDSLEESV